MPVQLDEQRVALAPNGSLIRRFDTNLPDPGQALARAGNNLGDSIYAFGEKRYQAEAEKAAKDAANAAPILKDENGNYTRGPTPSSFGMGTAKMFDDVLDQRYVNTVFQDTQQKLNEIHAANLNDPAKATELMNTHVNSVLKSMDPKFAGQLQAPFIREVNERGRQILYTNASRDREVAVNDLEKLKANELDVAMTAFSNGVPEKGQEALERARRMDESIAKNHSGSYDPAVFAITEKSVKASGDVLTQLRAEIDAGRVTEDQLDTVYNMLIGSAGNQAGQLGITQEWVNDNIPSDRVRQQLAAKVAQMKGGLSASFAVQKNEAAYTQFIENYTKRGLKGYMPGASAADNDKMVLEWARRGEINIATPDGARQVVQQFGFYPEEYAKSYFKGIGVQKPDEIDRRYALYNQLKNGQGVGNSGQASVALGALIDSDRAFLEHYGESRGAGNDKEAATLAARDAMSKGAPTPSNDRGGFLIKKFQQTTGKADYGYKELNDAFDSALKNGAKMASVPDEMRTALFSEAVTMASTYNLSPDKAVEAAAAKISRLWVADPTSTKGWNRADKAVPMATGPDMKPSRGYLKGYIQKIIDPEGVIQTGDDGVQSEKEGKSWAQAAKANKFKLSGGHDIPQDATFNDDGSGNIKLLPANNGTFALVYQDKTGPHPIVGENGLPVQINVTKAAKMQDTFIKAQSEVNQRALRAWGEGVRETTDPATGQTTYDKPRPATPPPAWADPKLEDVIVDSNAAAGPDPDRLKKVTDSNPERGRIPNIGGSNDGKPTLPAVKASLTEQGDGNGNPSPPLPYDNRSGTGQVTPVEKRIRGYVDTANMKPAIREFATTLMEEFPTLQMTSGYRGAEHPAERHKRQPGEHSHGNAVDLSLKGMDLQARTRLMARITGDERLGGIGYYPNSDSIHVDFRDSPMAWGGNKRNMFGPFGAETPAWFKIPVTEWWNS